MLLTVEDLVFLREAGMSVSDEDVQNVLLYENRNYFLRQCECGARPFVDQHRYDCRHASILVEPDWYRRIIEEDWPVKRTQ
jgi:hypothetical protein